jgi:hypothetical protein
MKEKLNLNDLTFKHSKLGYCSDYQISDLFEWDRQLKSGKNTVFTDMTLSLANESDRENNYAWLIEPIDISPNNYTLIKKINNNFNKIFTHEKSLIEFSDKFTLIPFGCCWIEKNKQKIYNKTKNISIIASNKTTTSGHKLRHNIINSLKDRVDIFGRGWNPIESKLEGLKDYKFSIVVENSKRDYWFTEKLIDCFVTGTIPIYWGCPSIGDFFDVNGMLFFDNLGELNKIISNLDNINYCDYLPFIEENFKRAQNFLLPDELIFKHIKNNG